jgi:peptide/nickel transport system substrate-binding protein
MRRTKLISLITGAAFVLAACGAPAEQPAPTAAPPAAPTATSAAVQVVEATATPSPTVAPEAEFKESPDLAKMVSEGKLPPVKERLPEQPVVTPVREAIGKYGGTIQTASWWPGVGNVLLYISEPPIKWKADLTGYEPGLAESYEWSDDGKTFTLKLRKGLKWSDGQPYTSADWKFWWEDMVMDEDYKGSVSRPAWLRKSDGSLIDMEFPDDYTVVWKSDQPQWIAPFYTAQGFWEFANPMMKPAHYLKQFHPKYSPDKTYDDLQKADQWWLNPEFPCLFAWCLTELSTDGQNYKFTRNPYYWRVDEQGNQLPYIDAIAVEIVSDEQVRILNCAQGRYDTAFRICGGPNEIPLLREKAEASGYRFLENYMNGAGAWPGYMVNQYYVEGGKNYPDDTPEMAAEIRAVLRDKRFRQALSLGMDRERMIDVAWGGIGEAKGATISPQSWHFAGPQGQEVYKKWASAYAEFDPDKANALLDEVGMKKGADGFRTLPSGKPFELVLDISDWGGSLKVQVDAAAEAKAQWEANLGLKVKVNNLQGQPELDTRTNEGQYMLRGAHISEIDIWTYPDWIFPIVNRYMFPLEGRWYAEGKDKCKLVEGQPYSCGVKPEADSPAAKLQALYEKGQQTRTIEDRHKVVWEAIDVIVEEGPFVIGVAGDQPMPIIVKNYMRNILDYGVVGPWAPATPGNQIAATWWMDK